MLTVSSAAEMLAAGEALGRSARAGDTIGLAGPLGAGKTVFVRGLARGLDVPPEVPVVSPTFTIINELRGGRLPLFHVDLYRIERVDDLFHIGLCELFDQYGVVAVEWFERFASELPGDRLELRIEVVSEDVRRIEATPRGPSAAALVGAWRNG